MLTLNTNTILNSTPCVMAHPHPQMQFTYPLPYGAIIMDGGVQFHVFSRNATAIRVLLYDKVSDTEPSEIVELRPEADRWGDIWSLFIPGISAGQLYHFQADGPFDPSQDIDSIRELD